MTKKQNCCGGISSKDLEKFTKASYKKKKDAQHVSGYTLDKDLSTKRSKVYVDPLTSKVVVAHAGTDSLSDWGHNFSIINPFQNYANQDRYKRAEKVQIAANKKYGIDNVTTTSHSQSGAIAKELARKGLTKSSVSLNPAVIGKHKGVQVVRSAHDPVSLLTHMGKHDVTIDGKTMNLLIEHKPSTLSRIDREFGGYLKPRGNGMVFVMD